MIIIFIINNYYDLIDDIYEKNIYISGGIRTYMGSVCIMWWLILIQKSIFGVSAWVLLTCSDIWSLVVGWKHAFKLRKYSSATSYYSLIWYHCKCSSFYGVLETFPPLFRWNMNFFAFAKRSSTNIKHLKLIQKPQFSFLPIAIRVNAWTSLSIFFHFYSPFVNVYVS